ncbi:MAG: AAA family ATPase [Bacilli bacterium]|nr:AAA family ATPase [Bacilli bacterium]
MTRQNEHHTILMEKIIINPNTYLFKPISILEGNFNEKSGEFIDKFDNTYFSMYDVDSIGPGSEETYCISMYYNEEDLREDFPAETKFDSIKLMADYYYDNIWLGFVVEEDEREEIIIIGMPVVDIEDKIIVPFENDNKQIIYFDANTNIISEKCINELLKINDLDKLKEALKNLNGRSTDSTKDFFENENEPEYNKDIYENQFTENIMTKIKQPKDIDSDKLYKEINIEEMYNYITERVIGQDEAVKQVITIFIMNKIKGNESIEEELTRILLTGPTGCGKSLIITTMLEYLSKVYHQNFPVANVPTSQLTIAGYVGSNLEDILDTLVHNTTGIFSTDEDKIKFAEHNGIVFLDEIDKKGSANNGDISGRGVLNSLLGFLSGSDYEIRKGSRLYKFNTKNLTIFAAGAFTNVLENNKKSDIGFNSKSNSFQSQVKVENLINEGLMPNELMGRFHRIINLNPISEEVLRNILLNSKISTLLTYQAKLKKFGVDLNWEEAFINKIATEAYKRKLGARSLKSLIEESLSDIQWKALGRNIPGKITVTDETVDHPKRYIYKP